MKCALLSISLLFVTVLAMGQDYKKLTSSTKCAIAIQEKQDAIKSLTADFKEVVHSDLFDKPVKAEGKFWFKKQQKIRWEHITPKKQILLISGKKVRLSQNGKEIKDPTAKIMVKKIQQLMMQVMSGDFLSSKDFELSYIETTASYQIKMVPTSSKMAKYIQAIVLVFNKSDLLLKEMTLLETEQNKIVYTFSSIQQDAVIPDTKFTDF